MTSTIHDPTSRAQSSVSAAKGQRQWTRGTQTCAALARDLTHTNDFADPIPGPCASTATPDTMGRAMPTAVPCPVSPDLSPAKPGPEAISAAPGDATTRPQTPAETQTGLVSGRGGSREVRSHRANGAQRTTAAGFADFHVALAAAALDDIERARIATENRVAASEREGIPETPHRARARALADELVKLEKQAIRDLEKTVRDHPLHGWIDRSQGVGLKQGGRMIAAIGDPLTKPPQINRETGEIVEPERPRRGPAELRQYCGHGDPARSRRRKGQKVEFNPAAKMRVHLVAAKCVGQKCEACRAASASAGTTAWMPPAADCGCPPYRRVYDRARLAWQDRDTTDGHKHNHAVRMIGKEIILDLWLEAKRNQ